MFRRFRRAALLLTAVGVLAVAVVASSASPALGYGQANWQVTANGTGVVPGGGGFGFWGWCEFTGGVTSGNDGDCEFAQYVHGPEGFTCHISLDVTGWTGAGGTFVITGTASVNPAAVAGPCLAFFPGSANFSGVDTGIPSAPGHYSLGTFGGAPVGEFNIQVNQIP